MAEINIKLQEKIELIKEHKTDLIAGLNAYLDRLYNIQDEYLTPDGDFITNVNGESIKTDIDEGLIKFLEDTKNDAIKFEKLRHKIIKDDFNLSLYEINLISLIYLYLIERWNNDIKFLTRAKEEASVLYKKLVDLNN